MKELLMSKPNGGESSIIRADITVGETNNVVFGYISKKSKFTDPDYGLEPIGNSTNDKVLAIYTKQSSGTSFLEIDYKAFVCHKVVRLDNMLEIFGNEEKSGTIPSTIFTEADIGNTIPVEIYIDILEE